MPTFVSIPVTKITLVEDNSKTAACAVTVLGRTSAGGIRVVFSGPVDEVIDLTENGNLSLSKSRNDTLTLIPPAGFDSYTWTVGGYSPETSSEPTQRNYSASEFFSMGPVEITLICEKGGRAYSKSLTVRIIY